MKKEMDKIADYLLLRSSYMQELGLFHGKMGVVVALYLYADAYGDEVMREYAWELFQQVYDGVHTDMAGRFGTRFGRYRLWHDTAL